MPHLPRCGSMRELTVGPREAKALRLDSQDEAESAADRLDQLPIDPHRGRPEVPALERHHLRHIGDGVPREPGDPPGDSYVSRGLGQPEVGGERYGEHRRDPAPVERVGLHDDHRETASRPGAVRLRPADPPALDYQSASRGRARAWTWPSPGPTRAPSWPWTASSRAVICSA